eukprot:8840391-Pyramimonas_sp.AAC.1
MEITRGLALGAEGAAPPAPAWAAPFSQPNDVAEGRRARQAAARPAMQLPPAVLEEMRRATPDGRVQQLP